MIYESRLKREVEGGIPPHLSTRLSISLRSPMIIDGSLTAEIRNEMSFQKESFSHSLEGAYRKMIKKIMDLIFFDIGRPSITRVKMS